MASKPKKARSLVWEYFDLHDDTHDAICHKCKEKIPRTKGSTWLMIGHLKSHGIDLSGEQKKPHQQIGASTSNTESMQEVQKVKDIMKSVHDKIIQERELNTFLKRKISDLENSKRELVGVFGRTGAGKSSLINAIIGEKDLLPSGDSGACTSVMIQVQANMKDSKYIAEIEFIPAKEWEDELWDFLKNRDSEKNEEGDRPTDDDDIKEKISALYVEEDAKNFLGVADYMDNKNFKEITEFRQSQKKTLRCKTSSELAEEIAKYTRRDKKKTGRRYWPLVKCVTIKVPNARDLLQHVALVDLPGTGDCNKSRDEMWKKFVGDCSAVWIVSDKSRADSEKEPWEILNQTTSLIGNGGECRSISFICTKCDVIDDKYKKPKEDRRAHVLEKNLDVKDRVLEKFNREKGVIEKHFSGDSGFFQVFTVTSKEFNRLKYLQADDTEIPKLQQFLKDLNDHQAKVDYYVPGDVPGGILSLMKAANTPDTGSHIADVCKSLTTRLQRWIVEVEQTMMKCKEPFERCLDEGVRLSLQSCEEILEGVTRGEILKHYSSLKSLVQNNGIYKAQRNKKKIEVNLNERLSKHMRETIDQEFSKTFPNVGRPGPITVAIDKFTLDTDSLSDKHKGIALQMTFLKTEEETLKKILANVIREEKKKIYFSLTESIQESMKPCYGKAVKHRGPGMQENMRKDMKEHLNTSKCTLFEKAKEHMLDKVECLKKKVKSLQEDMLTSIEQSLKINGNSVPDITVQYDEVKIIYGKLKSSSANTGSSESSSSVLTADHVRCHLCGSIMRDPLSIPCGHSFCKTCINKCWAQPSPSGDYVCPMCEVGPVLSVNAALSWVLPALQQTASSTLAQTGEEDEDEEEGEEDEEEGEGKEEEVEEEGEEDKGVEREGEEGEEDKGVEREGEEGEEDKGVEREGKEDKGVEREGKEDKGVEREGEEGEEDKGVEREGEVEEEGEEREGEEEEVACEDTQLPEQECSSARMEVIREEPMDESEEHQEIASKRMKLEDEAGGGEEIHHLHHRFQRLELS